MGLGYGGSELELSEVLADTTACGGNLLDQTDRLFRARHGGDLALQSAGAFPVGGPIQEGEHVCPDGQWVDVRRSEQEPSTSRKDEIADDILIGPLGED